MTVKWEGGFLFCAPDQMENEDAGDKSRWSLDRGCWKGNQGPARAASDRLSCRGKFDVVKYDGPRGNRWELNIPKPFLKPSVSLAVSPNRFDHQARTRLPR